MFVCNQYPWKKLLNIGKKSRAQQKGLHTCESKSFAIRSKELEQEHPIGVGDIEFYEITHNLKNGDIVDDEAKRMLEEAKTAFEQYKQENPNSSITDLLKAERKIMSKVRGPERCGRIRGLGLGPTLTSVGISKASSSKNGKLRRVKKELKDLKGQMSAVLGILKDAGLDLSSITARVNANQPSLSQSSSSQPSSSQQSYSSQPVSSSQMQ